MSGIVGSKFNIRGSGLVGSLGTDGQHMLSAGAGKSNVFETVAAGGGAWEYICRQTLGSDAAIIEFKDGTAATDGTPDFSSTYCTIMFHLGMMTPATDGGQLFLQISTDAGSNYLTAGYLSGHNYVDTTVSAASNNALKGPDGYCRLSTSTWNDASAGQSGFVYLENPSVTSKVNTIWFQTTLLSEGTDNLSAYYGGSVHTTAQDCDALKFYFHSGNVLSGSTIRMYGLTPS